MLKTNKIKTILLLLLVCLVSVAICACGEKSSSSSEKSSSTNSVTETSSNEETSSSEQTSTSVHTHSYTETVTTQPGCETKGEKQLTCSCGDTKTEDIAATGHTWNSGEVTAEPSCEAVGTKTFSCTVSGCNGSKTEDVAATGHSWDNGTVTAEADCATGTAGNKHFACTVAGCDGSKDEVISATHNYGADNICTGCGDERSAIVLDLATLTNGNISSTIVVDEVYTIIPGDKALTLEDNAKTAEDGTAFTKRLKTGGASDLGKKRRLISINVSGPATVKVYAVSGNSSDTTRTVDFYGVMGIIGSQTVDVLALKAFEFEAPKAGVYYIGCNNGISIYGVECEIQAGVAVTAEPFTITAEGLTPSDNISSNMVINDKATLLATSNGIFKIAATEKASTDGKTFTQRITFNTTGKLAEGKCVLQLSVPASGTLTIYCKSSSKEIQRALLVEDGAGFSQQIVAEKDFDPEAPTTSGPELVTPQTVTLTHAGDFFIYSTGGGVYLYEINYVPQA